MNRNTRSKLDMEVRDVIRAERRRESRQNIIKQKQKDRLEILDSKGYHFSGKDKRRAMEQSARSTPLTSFGLKQHQSPRKNYFEFEDHKKGV